MRCMKFHHFPGFCLTWIVGYDMKKSFLDNFRRINCPFGGIFMENKDCFSIFCQNLKINTWHPQNLFSALAPNSPRGLPTHFVVDGHILLTQNWLWESSLSLLSLWCIFFWIKLGLFRENLNLEKHLWPKNRWSLPSTFWHRLIYQPCSQFCCSGENTYRQYYQQKVLEVPNNSFLLHYYCKPCVWCDDWPGLMGQLFLCCKPQVWQNHFFKWKYDLQTQYSDMVNL